MSILWYLKSPVYHYYLINILIFTFFYLATCCGRLYSFHTNEIYLNKTYLLACLLASLLTYLLTNKNLNLTNEIINYKNYECLGRRRASEPHALHKNESNICIEKLHSRLKSHDGHQSTFSAESSQNIYTTKRNLSFSRSSFCSIDLEFKEYQKLDPYKEENSSDSDIFFENEPREAVSLFSSANEKANKKSMKSIIDAIDNFAVHEKSKKVHDTKSDSFTLDNYFRTFSADSLREKCPNKEVFLVRIFPYSDWITRFTL